MDMQLDNWSRPAWAARNMGIASGCHEYIAGGGFSCNTVTVLCDYAVAPGTAEATVACASAGALSIEN